MTQIMDFLARLDDLAILRIEGQDATDFLHTQLSNDISGMSADEARLAAYCNPKGRMLGSLILWRETTDPGGPLLALAKADLVEPLLKRLRMFVLRAKVGFEVTPLKAYGAGFPTQSANAMAATWRIRREGPVTRISAPGAPGGPVREWLIVPEETDTAALAARLDLRQCGAGTWHAHDIKAGLGWVEQANVELFIPQSLNYDLSGGVSFTKGCYPGQEVVARAHFRGTVKRRAIPGYCEVSADFMLHAGMDIFDARRPGPPAGRIVNAAAGNDEGQRPIGWHVFMEISLADIGQADFRVLSPEGPAIRLLALPYPLEVKTVE